MFYLLAIIFICVLLVIGFIRDYHAHIRRTKREAERYGKATFRRFKREYNEICNRPEISKRVTWSPYNYTITFNDTFDHVTVAQFTDYSVKFEVPQKRHMLFGSLSYLRYCFWLYHTGIAMDEKQKKEEAQNYIPDLWNDK